MYLRQFWKNAECSPSQEICSNSCVSSKALKNINKQTNKQYGQININRDASCWWENSVSFQNAIRFQPRKHMSSYGDHQKPAWKNGEINIFSALNTWILFMTHRSLWVKAVFCSASRKPQTDCSRDCAQRKGGAFLLSLRNNINSTPPCEAMPASVDSCSTMEVARFISVDYFKLTYIST